MAIGKFAAIPGRMIPGRSVPASGLPVASSGGTLVAGVASAGKIGIHSIVVSATAPTGGTSPYSYQWQYNWLRGGQGWQNATGPGVTTLTAAIKNLGPSATYQVRLVYTDSASDVVDSNVLNFATRHLNWFPGLTRRWR